MWIRKNKGKLIAALMILAALSVAYFAGGSSKGAGAQDSASAPSSAAPTVTVSPQGTDRVDAPAPSPAPEADGQASAAPAAPVQTPDASEVPVASEVPAATQAPAASETPAPTPEAPQCTISVSCAVLLNAGSGLDDEKSELVPADGWILPPTTVTIAPGESVFDILLRVCREAGVLMEFSRSPIYNAAYIEGIGNLYEFDAGELSGWMYSVNDVFPNFGCSAYAVAAGDVIRWQYSCDMGADIGGSNFR